MKLKDTVIKTGGMFRCCIASIESHVFDHGDDEAEDTSIQCEHCGATIFLKDCVWVWRENP